MNIDITNDELRALGPSFTQVTVDWLGLMWSLFDTLHAASRHRLERTPAGTLRSYARRLRALGETLGQELERRGPVTVDDHVHTRLDHRAAMVAGAGDDWVDTSMQLSDTIDAVSVHIGIVPVLLRATPVEMVTGTARANPSRIVHYRLDPY